MAVNDTRLNVTEFDFDEVKNNLKISSKVKQNLRIMILKVLA